MDVDATRRNSRAVAVSLLAALTAIGALAASRDQTPPDAKPRETDRVASARALLVDDDWASALTLARQAVESDPERAEAVAVLGEALFRAGRMEEVDALLRPAAADSSAAPRALATLARLRAAAGRGPESDRLMARAVDAAPNDREIVFWAGDLTGDRKLAVDLLGRYLELRTGDKTERDEAVEGTIRLFKQLGTRAIWVAERRPERVELPLTRIWDSAGNVQGYVLQARIGDRDKPVRLLLDTGTSGLFLLERVARKRGFEPLAEKTVFGGGGKRRHTTERGLFGSFTLGDLAFTDALASTTRKEFDSTGRFHGLLGIGIFAGYRITLDLAEERLLLERRDDSFEGSAYWWISGQMLVEAQTAGQPRGLFLFDTGATASVLALEYVRRIDETRLQESTAVRGFGGLVEGARLVRGLELQFQRQSTGDRPLVAYDLSLVSRLGGVEVSGLMGLDLVGRGRIIIDSASQQVRIESFAD
jgi:tetratricopeptide (TPR) repeat protein